MNINPTIEFSYSQVTRKEKNLITTPIITMRTYFLKKFNVLLLVLLHTSESTLGFNWPGKLAEVKCIERERQALLKFKEGVLDDAVRELSRLGQIPTREGFALNAKSRA